MTEIDEIFSAMSSEVEEVSKRDFLVEKVKNGESISNSNTPWTVERLEKSSDKVVERLYEKYVNPPPVKVNKQDACLLYTSPSPRDGLLSRMPSSA